MQNFAENYVAENKVHILVALCNIHCVCLDVNTEDVVMLVQCVALKFFTTSNASGNLKCPHSIKEHDKCSMQLQTPIHGKC